MQFVLERCAIRPWRLNDAESVARHANNLKVWLALRDLFPHPYTIQDAHEFLQRTNPASTRVLKKAGFSFEGRLKNNVLKDGKLLDSLLYARTT